MNTKSSLLFSIKIFVFCILLCALVLFLCFAQSLTVNNKSTHVISERLEYSVIIDAGHGGRDGGAVSKSGVVEKDLNLSVSTALNDILKLCGVKTVMTRESDSLVCDESDPNLKGKLKLTDLKNRLDIANMHMDSIFVSIHMNTFPIEKYNGLQVYYSARCEESIDLALSIQENIVEIMQPYNERKVKKAGSGIYILNNINIPAVLVECGFLSNEEEVEKLSSSIYRAKISLVLAASIMQNLESASNN